MVLLRSHSRYGLPLATPGRTIYVLVLLDDAVQGRRRAFQAPLSVIAADRPDQVPAALAAVTAALDQGRFVAGWLGYELGHVLEPRLAVSVRPGPLLRLGVFAGPSDAPPVPGGRTPGGRTPGGRTYVSPLRPEWDQAAYAARFSQVKDLIAAGDIYQANLSFRAHFGFLGEARALYEQLLAVSGAAHCGFVDDGARQVLSLSPELFFDLAADGAITVRPMKGTLARDGDDAAGRARLAASPKDRAENLMIVDLIRNDLSRLAVGGSVAVSNLFQVETYPTLHTMVSTVAATLRPGAGVTDILRALFPCGSITGAPKIRAMEILRDLETSPRGAYCGAVGYFAPDRSAHFNVAIRTITLSGGRGELGIGGGVGQDSVMESEYAECLLKARFFETARKPLELIETLGWRDGRFTRLPLHMARMEASARVLGLSYNSCDARLALQAAVEGKKGKFRIRLTLDEAGALRATAHALPDDPPHWTYAVSPLRTDSADPLLRHKTTWREMYDAEAKRSGSDEVIFRNARGELTEGARSNIFVRRDGVLLTPPLDCGLLPGCLRAELLETGQAREAVLTPADLQGEVWFGNSLRGLILGTPI